MFRQPLNKSTLSLLDLSLTCERNEILDVEDVEEESTPALRESSREAVVESPE
jgi:hypothetical protein